jgi:hypothetical protein
MPNGSLEQGSASLKKGNMQVEVLLASRQQQSCCARHRRFVRSLCCCAFLLAALGALAIVFWPRLLVICALYADSAATVRVVDQAAVVGVTMPVSIESRNLWGLSADVSMAAFYDGNRESALTRGVVPLALVPMGTTRFDVEMTAPDANGAQAANVLADLVRDCGPLLSSGFWRMDVQVDVRAYGAHVAGWSEDLEMPCATAAAAVPLVRSNSSTDGCGNDGSQPPPSGRYCVRLLCALDDLSCEERQPPCPPPPAAPPPPPPSAPPLLSGVAAG